MVSALIGQQGSVYRQSKDAGLIQDLPENGLLPPQPYKKAAFEKHDITNVHSTGCSRFKQRGHSIAGFPTLTWANR